MTLISSLYSLESRVKFTDMYHVKQFKKLLYSDNAKEKFMDKYSRIFDDYKVFAD